jgi:protein TonB
MSNVSIFEKKWLDLVFEGKNQKYGAYQLRRESSRTTLFAFLFGITFLVGGTFLLSSFSAKPIIITEDPFEGTIIHVDPYNPPIDEPKLPKVEKQKIEPVTQKAPEDNKHYVVAHTPEAVTPVTKTVDTPTPNVPTSPTAGTGTPTGGGIFTGGGTAVIPKIENNNPVNSKELDRQPMFPGGLKGFYEYVGNNFERQEIEEGETVRVLVSFVIEKNGTMTDIEVTEKTTVSVDKEAIRVLKSLRTKWTPGYKDGEPVRTQYTLPITVKSE